jgi:hypothetical protein
MKELVAEISKFNEEHKEAEERNIGQISEIEAKRNRLYERKRYIHRQLEEKRRDESKRKTHIIEGRRRDQIALLNEAEYAFASFRF